MSGVSAPAGEGLFSSKVQSRLRLGLTLLTFAVIAWYLRTRPRPDASLLSFRWEFAFAASACLVPLIALRTWKWRALLRPAAHDATFALSLRSYLGAMALGLVTPGRIGEFSRGAYLPQPALRGWRGAGLVLIDNWLDFLAVLAWACLGWAVAFGSWGLAAGIALAILFGPIASWLRAAGRLSARLPKAFGVREAASNALAAGADLRRKDWLAAGSLGFLAYGVEWFQAALFIGFLAPTVPDLAMVAGLMALVTLANSVQVTLAGLGVREGLAMVLLARAGVGPEAAVLAAFLQSAVNLFLPALAGLAVGPAAPRVTRE